MERDMFQPRRHPSISYEKLRYITVGKSGVVYEIDDQRILKEYHSEGRDVERRAYELLGSHPNIARYLDSTENGSIILERGQVLRTICQKAGADQIPLYRKLRWLKHAAEGLRHVHENGIVQADVGCNNMILAGDDCLKLIDFEGCSIDGKPADSLYEWFSYRRSTPTISTQTDIFAYGCVIYEVMTGRPPYHELETSDNPSSLVEQLYEQNQFPDVAHLPLGELMQSCWHGTVSTMNEVMQALEAASLSSLEASVPPPLAGEFSPTDGVVNPTSTTIELSSRGTHQLVDDCTRRRTGCTM
jgi:serine/threonine protein kinase